MNEFTYMNYMTESERESYIAEKAIEDEFEKLNLLYEMCNLQQRIHTIDVENKVLTENGSFDDYAVLLMEANQQVSQEKQGILAKIFDWFAKVFESLHKAIADLFAKKVDPQKDVQMNAGLMSPEFSAMLDGLIKDAKGYAMQIISGAAIQVVAEVFKNGLGATINKGKQIAKNFLNNPKVVKVKAAVSQGVMGKIDGAISAINEVVNKISDKFKKGDVKTDSDGSKVQGVLTQLKDALMDIVKNPMQSITKALTGALNTPAADQNAQAQPAAAPQQPQQAAPAPAPATNPQPAQPAQPVTASTETEKINDGELSLYESVFGKLEEEKKEDDISDLLDMI
jgi:hypothetical protein